MTMRAQELYNKWINGAKHGFLTDYEVDELTNLLMQVKDLSIAFDAGNACVNYFVQLWYNIEQVRHARRLS